MDVEPSDTIADVRRKLAAKGLQDAQTGKLTFAQKDLQNIKRLSDYNTQKETTIHFAGSSGTIMGATTLQEKSEQTFESCEALNVDETKKTSFYVRLVGRDEAKPSLRSAEATALSTLMSPSVPI